LGFGTLFIKKSYYMAIEGNIYDPSMATRMAINGFSKKLSFLDGHLYFAQHAMYLSKNNYIYELHGI